MRDQYDFSKGKRNPYAKKLTTPVTLRMDVFTLKYFKDLAVETQMPYQTLINLYLRECAAKGKRLSLEWRETK